MASNNQYREFIGLGDRSWEEQMVDPNAWRGRAKELYRAASILRKQKDEENNRNGLGVYLMLLGMCCECALKARYVSEDQPIRIKWKNGSVLVTNSNWSSGSDAPPHGSMDFINLEGAGTHDLVAMARSVESFSEVTFPAEEISVLGQLQLAITYGRYPVLKTQQKSARSVGSAIEWETTNPQVVDDIINRCCPPPVREPL